MLNCIKRPFYFVLLLLTLLVEAVCTAQSNPIKPIAPAEADTLFDYRLTTLDNGLTVVTLEDFSAPLVAVQVWYAVGSKDEQSDRQGYAHMFEHMMFKGTDRVGDEDHFNFIRKVGGACNAYTSFDQTVYLQTLPSRELELALWLEAERMAFLRIDQEAFDTERKVVEEELRMGENRPYGNVFKKMAAALFSVHPYRWTPIGNIAHLRATSVADLRAFWNTYYVPNNATLLIVGAIKHADAVKAAERYFGWIPAGPKPPRIDIVEPMPAVARTIIIDDENAPAGQTILAWRTVPVGHPDETALDALSEILGGGNSSRVYRKLVAESQIAVDAGSWAYNLQQAGLFSVSATLPPTSEEYEIALAALETELEAIRTAGIHPEELEKARNQLLKRTVTSALGVENKARMLGSAAVTLGNIARVNTLLEDIRAVTAEDVQRVANRWLGKEKVFRFIVKKNADGMLSARKDNEDALITAKPETLAPPPGRAGVERLETFPHAAPFAAFGSSVFDLPFEEAKLPNGLTVMVVSNRQTPYVSMTLGIQNGAWTEYKPGLAAMTLAMLTRGTATRSEAQLASELERYAITLSGSADRDNAIVSMDCLSEHLERAMTLARDVVQCPAFDAKELAKLLTQEIAGLKIRLQNPDYLAETHFYQAVFGEHPYGRPVKGTPEQLEQLGTDDLRLWWQKFARPDQATLIFAGDITLPQAMRLAEANLGDWKTDQVETGLMLPDVPPPSPTRIVLVDRPGSAQTQLRVGHLGITRRQQPDYFYALLAGNYFGGSFNSRLNDSLRIQRGLTYGANGGFTPMMMAGVFEIATFTRNDAVAESVKVIIDQVRQFQTLPPTEDEFNQTRSFFLGSFARHRETPQQIARDLWMMQSQRLGRDYLKTLFDAIEKASPADCIAFAQKTVRPEELLIVAVGDASAIKESLEQIAPVTVVK